MIQHSTTKWRTFLALVSFLGNVCLAEAKIVYTPVNVTVVGNGSLKMDLNHGGRVDFTIWALAKGQACGSTGGQSIRMVTVSPANGNAVVATATSGFAAALNSGVQVPSGQIFTEAQALMAQSVWGRGCGPSFVNGNWVNANNLYLGLKFLINGQVHYGWAELSVHIPPGFRGHLSVTLTGFAYETIPGHAITTGQMSGALDEVTDAASSQ